MYFTLKQYFFAIPWRRGGGMVAIVALLLGAPPAMGQSTDATLSALTLTEEDNTTVTLSPIFASDQLSYTASVDHDVAFINVEATRNDPNAGLLITPNDAKEGTGAEGHQVSLRVGSNNTITVRVTAAAGNTETYTITVTRAESESTDATLSTLTLSTGTLSPTFDSAKTSYTAEVVNTVTSITVTATPNVSQAMAEIGEDDATGSGHEVSLNVGANTIRVTVTAVAGNTKTYTITVTRAASPATDATLSALSLSGATLKQSDDPTKGFDPNVETYTTSVAHLPAVITVTATPTVLGATPVTTPADAAPGTGGHQVSLNVGANTITVTVTATDNSTTKTYTITVTRAASPATDATLSVLSLSGATLKQSDDPTKGFDPDVETYTTSVAHLPAVITVTATPTVSGATPVTTPADAAPGTGGHQVSLNVGANTITVTVTATDNSTTKTYTITVTRAASPATDATLSVLSLSGATLKQSGDPTKGFDPDVETYTAEVANSVTSITVTATPTVSGATPVTTPADAVPGTGGHQVSLNVGANTITVTVTPADGTSTAKTYTITVTRAASESTDATLSVLSLSTGTLSPTFYSATTTYTASVAHDVAFITVTATPTVSGLTPVITPFDSRLGIADHQVSLRVGANTITVEVTAQDGITTETYTITVTRGGLPSTDATLSTLSITGVTLSPGFDPGTISYTASVAHTVTSVTVAATSTVSGATVAVTPTDDDLVTDDYQIPLDVGENTIRVTVTARDRSTTETYTIRVNRAVPPNTDATLLTLTLTDGSNNAVTLSPIFYSATTSYTADVRHDATSITVAATPTATGGTPVIKPDDSDAIESGHQVDLAVGTATIRVEVTAPDGKTKKTYTIRVTRVRPVQDATLRALSLSPGTLSPSFSSNQTSYTASVAYAQAAITVTAVPTVSGATARIGGADARNGHSVSLSVGSNTIRVVVTAPDGTTTKTYQITLTRLGSPADATLLRSLTLSGATLSPSFSSSRTSYTASVANSVSSITITAAPAVSGSGARIGNADATSGHRVSLSVGSNTIRVVVTAQDGTRKTYRITVTRAGRSTAGDGGTPPRRDPDPPTTRDPDSPTTRDPDPPLSNDATLKELALSGGAALSPAFAPSTTQYTAEVGANISVVTVTATRAHTRAKVTFSSADADAGRHGQQIALVEGDNTITIDVVAQDGKTTKQYTLIITRLATGQEPEREPEKDPPPALAADATLKMLSVSGGGAVLSPAFSSSTIAYIAQVGSNIGIVTVTAEANAAEASVVITPGDADKRMAGHQVPLRSYGGNQVTVVVIAEDGTTKTYSLTVHRLAPKGGQPAPPSQDATLKALAVSAGTLTPAFAATHQLYTAQVAHHVATLTVIPVAAAAGARVTITPADADLATDGHQVALQVGDNPVAVLVTATDGKKKAYILTITRAAQADGAAETDVAAGLRSLTISEGTLTPAFAATTYQYTAQVAHHVATLTVAASARTGASVTFTPADAAPATDGHQVALQVGDNPVAVLVTATDGKKKAYILTITRAAQADGAAGLQFVGSVPDQHYTAGAAIAPLVVPEAVGGQGQVAYRMAACLGACRLPRPPGRFQARPPPPPAGPSRWPVSPKTAKGPWPFCLLLSRSTHR